MRKGNHWILTESGNYCMYGKGYYISYNPSINASLLKRSPRAFRDFSQESDPEETALYIEESGTWHILNGDFRLAYEQCASLNACKAIYAMYSPYYGSPWSSENFMN